MNSPRYLDLYYEAYRGIESWKRMSPYQKVRDGECNLQPGGVTNIPGHVFASRENKRLGSRESDLHQNVRCYRLSLELMHPER